MLLSLSQLASNCICTKGICLENGYIPHAYPLPTTHTTISRGKKSMVCLQGFLACLTNNKAAFYLKTHLNNYNDTPKINKFEFDSY